jgi:hypothetical protein
MDAVGHQTETTTTGTLGTALRRHRAETRVLTARLVLNRRTAEALRLEIRRLARQLGMTPVAVEVRRVAVEVRRVGARASSKP